MNDYKAKILKEAAGEFDEQFAARLLTRPQMYEHKKWIFSFLTRALDGLEAEIKAKVEAKIIRKSEEIKREPMFDLHVKSVNRGWNAALDDILTLIPSPSKHE